MSGIYIKGLKMPEEADDAIIVYIYGDGRAIKTGEIYRDKESDEDDKYWWIPDEHVQYSAIKVPHHGDLIDRETLRAATGMQLMCEGCKHNGVYGCKEEGLFADVCGKIDDAPVVIPGEEEVNEM